jgi:hypothetical protein
MDRGASNSQGPDPAQSNWELQELRKAQTSTWTLQGL